MASLNNQVDSHHQHALVTEPTFFLHSEKGSRYLHRPARKRGGKAAQRGRSKEQVCVLVARDRSGATFDCVMPVFDTDHLETVLKPRLAADTLLCSDGLNVYSSFSSKTGIQHQVVYNQTGERVFQKVFHIQNVNAYHSRLKGWIFRFHGVATRYLTNYLGWFRWLDHAGTRSSPLALLFMACGRGQQALVT